MAAENQVLHADIVAEDAASAELRKVKAELDQMKNASRQLNHELHETGLSFALLAERTEMFRDHFGELGAVVGETGERFAELSPALEIFGAAASTVGLIDLTREAAEARTQLSAMAEEIGISTEALEGLRLAARETDVPVEAMQTGMVKLQRSMVDAASGKNKTAGEIFGRMGIGLRDAHGHMRNVNDVLPLVAESLRRTEDTTLRNAVAMQLFGRSGAELIPFLKLGRDGMERLSQVSEGLSAHYSAKNAKDVEEYKNSWVELDASLTGLKDTITADLAPVLTPIVHEMRDWIAANKEWLGSSIRDDVKELGADLKQVDFKEIQEDLREVKRATTWVADLAGGWHRVFEAMALIAAVRLAWGLTRPIRQIGVLLFDVGKLSYKLNHDLVGAWRNVGKSAAEAAAAEEVAASVGVGGLKKGAGIAGKAAAAEGEAVAEGAASKAAARGVSRVGGAALEGLTGLAGLALGGGELAALGGIGYTLFDQLPVWLNELMTSFGPTHAALSNGGRGGAAHVADPNHDASRHYGRGWTANAYIPPGGAASGIVPPASAPAAFDIPVPVAPPSLPKIDLPPKIEVGGAFQNPRETSEAGGAKESDAERPSAEIDGAVTVNVRFENAPDGMTATMETTGNARAGTIDRGQNNPVGGGF